MNFNNLITTRWDSQSKPVRYNSGIPFVSFDMDMHELFNDLNCNDFYYMNPFDSYKPYIKNHFPKVDIAEAKNEFLISAELPGMDDKDVDVMLDDRTLSIKGKKKKEKDDKQKENYSAERSHDSFDRSFQIPVTIERNKIVASFKKGILTVRLPKTPEKKNEVKIIPINQ